MTVNFKNWQKNLNHIMDSLDESFEEVVAEEELNLEEYSLEDITAFMQTEDFDQLDEVSKATVKSYVSKKMDKIYAADNAPGKEKAKRDVQSLQRAHERIVGNKPTSEEVQKKTYSQFVEEMQKACGKKGSKIVIHDGDEDSKKVTEAHDDDDYGWNHKEKEKPQTTSRKIAGRAYGGAAQKDDDDEDTPKQTEKRGRGRPKGSTSGARTQGAAKKSYGGLAIHSLSLPNRNK